MSGLTPFQTVGPYLHLGLRYGLGTLTSAVQPSPIVVHGRLIDGAGDGIPDGVLEFWAAGFDNVGRAFTDGDGVYRLATRKPPPRIDEQGNVHAPHFAVRVLGRGILTEYVTRVYFRGPVELEHDVVLARVPPERRLTLMAMVGPGPGEFRFDVVVQGERETVFFDC